MQIIVVILILILIGVLLVIGYYAALLLILPSFAAWICASLVLHPWCRYLLRSEQEIRSKIVLRTSHGFTWEYTGDTPYPTFPIFAVVVMGLAALGIEFGFALSAIPDPVFSQKVAAGIAVAAIIFGPYYLASKYREGMLQTVRKALVDSVSSELQVDARALQEITVLDHEYAQISGQLAVNRGRPFVDRCRDLLIVAQAQGKRVGPAFEAIVSDLRSDLTNLRETASLYAQAESTLNDAAERAIDLGSKSLLMQVDYWRVVLESETVGALIERRDWPNVSIAINGVIENAQRISEVASSAEEPESHQTQTRARWDEPQTAAEAYDVLGVAPDMTLAHITEIYKALVQRWHPDVVQDPDKKAERTKRTAILNGAMKLIRADKSNAVAP